jgi:23S rRNA pseudouridine1911/1915/1917 synthase
LTASSLCVEAPEAGTRLDLWLKERRPELSRSRIQSLVRTGKIRLNGDSTRPGHSLKAGDEIQVEVPEPQELQVKAEDIPLKIAYEDADILVVDKAAGMTVHPAPGSWDGTMVNALLHHCTDLSGINGIMRPGIVHRLDKGTSGLLAVAKNDIAHRSLAAQLEQRSLERRYLALCWGHPSKDKGTVDAPLARHPTQRKRMAVDASGRRARTHYRVIEEFPFSSLIELKLDTGRTHQIRVHLQYLGYPLVGDPTYGGRPRTPNVRPLHRVAALGLLKGLKRQALHAFRLGLDHPRSGERLDLSSEPPLDIAAALEAVRSL